MNGFCNVLIATTSSSSSHYTIVGFSNSASTFNSFLSCPAGVSSSYLGAIDEFIMLVESPVGSAISIFPSSVGRDSAEVFGIYFMVFLAPITAADLVVVGSVLRASKAATIQSYCVTILPPFLPVSLSTSKSLITLIMAHFCEISSAECLLLSGA